jgi:hypothetical protein
MVFGVEQYAKWASHATEEAIKTVMQQEKKNPS